MEKEREILAWYARVCCVVVGGWTEHQSIIFSSAELSMSWIFAIIAVSHQRKFKSQYRLESLFMSAADIRIFHQYFHCWPSSFLLQRKIYLFFHFSFPFSPISNEWYITFPSNLVTLHRTASQKLCINPRIEFDIGRRRRRLWQERWRKKKSKHQQHKTERTRRVVWH